MPNVVKNQAERQLEYQNAPTQAFSKPGLVAKVPTYSCLLVHSGLVYAGTGLIWALQNMRPANKGTRNFLKSLLQATPSHFFARLGGVVVLYSNILWPSRLIR